MARLRSTAARMTSFSASSSTLPPSPSSMIRVLLPSETAVKISCGSGRVNPAGKLSLTLLLQDIGGADDSGVLEHRRTQGVAGPLPLHFLDDLRVGVADDPAKLRQGRAAPVRRPPDHLIDEFVHVRHAASEWCFSVQQDLDSLCKHQTQGRGRPLGAVAEGTIDDRRREVREPGRRSSLRPSPRVRRPPFAFLARRSRRGAPPPLRAPSSWRPRTWSGSRGPRPSSPIRPSRRRCRGPWRW